MRQGQGSAVFSAALYSISRGRRRTCKWEQDAQLDRASQWLGMGISPPALTSPRAPAQSGDDSGNPHRLTRRSQEATPPAAFRPPAALPGLETFGRAVWSSGRETVPQRGADRNPQRTLPARRRRLHSPRAFTRLDNAWLLGPALLRRAPLSLPRSGPPLHARGPARKLPPKARRVCARPWGCVAAWAPDGVSRLFSGRKRSRLRVSSRTHCWPGSGRWPRRTTDAAFNKQPGGRGR